MARPHSVREAECGTPGGYRRHKRRGEDVCQACRDAMRAAWRRWRGNVPGPVAPPSSADPRSRRPAARDDWRRRAVCRDEDPELFFPVGTGGPALLQTAEAKAVCRRCPVTAECLAWAIAHSQEGIWGGTTHEERAALKPQIRMNRRAGAT